jgi:hypothetical protein
MLGVNSTQAITRVELRKTRISLSLLIVTARIVIMNGLPTLSRCETNTKFDGKCTIYALGDNIVWGNPQLYKELTGRE